MKIKTTMLSGVAGALALAAFLSAPAYGAAHNIVPHDIVPNVDVGGPGSPDASFTVDGNTLTNPIVGDVVITDVAGPTPPPAALYIQGPADSSSALASTTDTNTYPPEFQTAEYGGDSDLYSVFAPVTFEGQVDTTVDGVSGFIADSNGNVWLNSATESDETYNYDVATTTYVFGENSLVGDVPGGDPLNGAPVYVRGDGTIIYEDARTAAGLTAIGVEGGVLLAETYAGVWEDQGDGTFLFNAYTTDTLENIVDGSGLITDAGLKTFLEGYAETETRNADDPEGTTYYSSVTGDPSGGNLYVGGNAQIDGQLAVGDIPDVEEAITSNGTAIVSNAADIAMNVSAIASNDTAIVSNAADISMNMSAIASNDTAIVSNAADISMNMSAIASNDTAIVSNAADISMNMSAIASNATDISTNMGAIASNATDISTNMGAIASNATDISANMGAIASNATDISANAGAIEVNSSAIANNTTAIGANSTAIGENASDIEDLEGLVFVDPHGNTHLSGPDSDSLYTRYDETDGVQKLGAIHDTEDTDHPNVVTIDVETDLNVSGDPTSMDEAVFSVQKNDGGTSTDASDDFLPIAPIFDPAGDGDGDSVSVYTKTNENTTTTDSTANSGFVADSDGNVWLFKDGGSIDTVDYVTAIRVDVFDDTNDEGVAGTVKNTVEVGGYFNAAGEFVVLGELMDDDDLVDGLGTLDINDDTIFTDAVIAEMTELGLIDSEVKEGEGGNLYVEGDTELMGNLELGEIADVEAEIGMNSTAIEANVSRLDVHEGLVTTNISNIAVNTAGIATNVSRLDVHEGLVTTNISNIAVNTAGIATNVSRLDVHEGLVTTNISDIAVNAAGIATNVSRLDVHEGLVTTNISNIAVNASDIAAEVTARASADTALQGQIDGNASGIANNASGIQNNASAISSINSTLDTHFSLVSQNIQNIEKNTRGIAMTAALTHTTILPGMENALDLSMAYFEGETGISISYSRRINEGTQINFAAASTSDFEETVIRGGVGWQW